MNTWESAGTKVEYEFAAHGVHASGKAVGVHLTFKDVSSPSGLNLFLTEFSAKQMLQGLKDALEAKEYKSMPTGGPTEVCECGEGFYFPDNLAAHRAASLCPKRTDEIHRLAKEQEEAREREAKRRIILRDFVETYALMCGHPVSCDCKLCDKWYAASRNLIEACENCDGTGWFRPLEDRYATVPCAECVGKAKG